MIDKITSYFSRIFFFLALGLLFISIIEWFLRLYGWTLTWIHYTPARLLEFSVILIIFVIVLLLRQIRELLKHK